MILARVGGWVGDCYVGLYNHLSLARLGLASQLELSLAITSLADRASLGISYKISSMTSPWITSKISNRFLPRISSDISSIVSQNLIKILSHTPISLPHNSFPKSYSRIILHVQNLIIIQCLRESTIVNKCPQMSTREHNCP